MRERTFTLITGGAGFIGSNLADALLRQGERVIILAPIVRGRKGEFKKELEKIAKDFTRARIDGEMRQLDEEIRLDKRKNHTIEIAGERPSTESTSGFSS